MTHPMMFAEDYLDFDPTEADEEVRSALPLPIEGNTAIDDDDTEIITNAIKCLELYQQLLGQLPERKWLALSYANKIIWRQIEEQQDFLNDVVKNGYIPEMEA